MFEQFFKNHGFNGAPRPHKMSSLGSGFVIDASGIVITNNHVVGDANDVVVIFTDGRKLKATIIGKDPKVDVAVLKVESDKPFKTVKFGDSDKARVGDGVMAVGNPFGLGETVTAGILSARNRNIDSGPYDDFLQTDCLDQQGAIRQRPAVQSAGRGHWHQHGDPGRLRAAQSALASATPANSVEPVIDQLEKISRDPARLSRRAHSVGRLRHRREHRPRHARGARWLPASTTKGPAEASRPDAGRRDRHLRR